MDLRPSGCQGLTFAIFVAGSDASQWQVQEMESPPVGPAGNIFAEPRPVSLQGTSPNPDAELVPQLDQDGPSLVTCSASCRSVLPCCMTRLLLASWHEWPVLANFMRAPTQVQVREQSAPAPTSGQEAPQQPSRRERGFDPRRASVAMSSNFALHTAGKLLSGRRGVLRNRDFWQYRG